MNIRHKCNCVILLGLLIVCSAGVSAAKRKPLSQHDLLELLAGGVYNARIAQLVRDRGVSFVPSAHDLDSLQRAGADLELLNAVKLAVPEPAPPPTSRTPEPVRPAAAQVPENVSKHQLDPQVTAAEFPRSNRQPDTVCKPGRIYSAHDVIGDPQACILGKLTVGSAESINLPVSVSIGGMGGGMGMSP